MDVIRDLGGLHNFMQWDYGLASDSGGFQVFSLPCKVEEDGVLFSSPVDGSSHRLRPEDVMDIQYDLGSDIIMPLDCCMPHDVSFASQEKHMERTHRWLFRAMRHYAGKEKRKEGQALFPITQGGVSEVLRQRSSQEVLACGSIGYAIGGLSVGESREQRNAMLEISCAHLPVSSVRYLMGVGRPEDILEAISYGIDMFDCVMPTRNARNGMLFTTQGVVNIRNRKWKHDKGVLDAGLDNGVSRYYSRAYLRHLLLSHEPLGIYIASTHNLCFYAFLMERARQHIFSNTFEAWKEDMLCRLRVRC